MLKVQAVTIFVAIFLTMVLSVAGQIINTFKNTYTTMFENNIGMGILSESNVSMVTMPLTVRLALCKLAQAARGAARQEIVNAFSFILKYKNCNAEVQEATRLLRSFTILLLNKIYVNDSMDLNDSFLDKTTTSQFGVHVQRMKFNRPRSAHEYINKWFEMISLRRLPDVLDKGEVNNNTSILLVSAAHIQSTWEKPFNILLTREMKFRTINNTMVPVQMMLQRDSYLYYHDLQYHFQIITIPLTSYGMTMTFVLPDGLGKFDAVMRRLLANSGVLQGARHKMRYSVVRVQIPRFRIKSTFKWDEALKFFGINQIFNSTYSDLDLLKSHRDVRNMYVSLVKQKVFLKVDEMGAFRLGVPKATTDMFEDQFPLMKRNKEIGEFVADQPFLFSIDMQMSTNGDMAMFLAGVYYGPDY